MELCDSNLYSKLKKSKGFSAYQIKKILMQLNNTFRIMIDKKIIHRDIKLQNIVVKDRKVKLCDYGLAKQLSTLYQKKNKTYAGTRLTMAPEILEDKPYDSKSDLWSLGVIIYQMYFNDFPYKANTDVALLNNIKNDKNQNDLKKKSTGYKELDELIINLLKYNPDERLTWNEYFNHPFFK